MKLKQTLRCVFLILGIGVLLWSGRPIRADRPTASPVPYLTHSPTPQVTPGPLELISKAAPGQSSDAVALHLGLNSGEGEIDRFSSSDDGRFITFVSRHISVVAGQDDTSYTDDVFLTDRQTGVVTLVSHSILSPVKSANNFFTQTGPAVISGDGRYVVFLSPSMDLVAGITYPNPNDYNRQVYLFDRVLGTTILVSRSAASATTVGNSYCPSTTPKISADGRYVVFSSYATNLVLGQTGGNGPNLFLFDRVTGGMVLVNHTAAPGDGRVYDWDMTPDGQWVVFYSTSTNHVPGQTLPPGNVYLYNRVTQAITLVSKAAGSTGAANGFSYNPKISANGQIVVFLSVATNLVPGFTDTNGNGGDIFSADLSTGNITLVSHIPGSPLTTGNDAAEFPEMSADGNYIVYLSKARNLVPGQVDGSTTYDVFLFDRIAGTTTLVTHVPGSPAMAAGLYSSYFYFLAISRDGRWVAYINPSVSNLVGGQIDQYPGFTTTEVFLFDRLDGTNRLASHKYGAFTTTGIGLGMLSPFGFAGATNRVLFAGNFLGLTATPIPRDLTRYHLFGYDPDSGLVSVESHQSLNQPSTISGNGFSFSYEGSTSADGRYVVFGSTSTNLVPGPNPIPSPIFHGGNVFLADRATGTITLVSHAAGLPTTTANSDSGEGAISQNGRYIAFYSRATNLVEGQTTPDFLSNIFVFDRLTGNTKLVSHRADSANAGGNGYSSGASLSGDGRLLVFASNATDLISGGAAFSGFNIFLYNLETGTISLVSHAANSFVTAGNGEAQSKPVISADGSTIAYISTATNLVAGQPVTNHMNDVFVYSVATQTTMLASRPAFPQNTISGDFDPFIPVVLSDNGNRLVFVSNAGNLVTGQNTNNYENVFLFDRTTGTTQLVSHNPASLTTGGMGTSGYPSISGDGRVIVFSSTAPDLITGQVDATATNDVFAFDSATGNMTLISHIASSPVTAGGGVYGHNDQNGTAIAFSSSAKNLIAGQGQTSLSYNSNLFLFDKTTGTTILVSHIPGLPLVGAGFTGSFLSISDKTLVFDSSSPFLVTNDGNGVDDVFVAPLGPVNLNYPTVSAANGLTRQQGSTGSSSILGTVSDAQSPPGSLQVAVTAPTGISVTGLVNQNGTISGNITVACGVPLGLQTLVLRVTNGAGNATDAAVQVNITANTPPTVGSYQAVNVVLGSPTMVTPSAPPTDNGTVATVTVAASAGFSGPLTVNPATGVVSFTAGAEGTFTLTVTATDNCGSTTPQSFSVTVLPFGKGPVIGSLSPTSGPAGTSVTISGLNLTGVTQVTFNGRPAAFTVNAATQITATVPIGATTGPVAVAGPNGAATGPVFTVIRTK